MEKDTVVIIVKNSSVTKENLEECIHLCYSSQGIKVFPNYKVITQAEYDKMFEQAAISKCPNNDGRNWDDIIVPEILIRSSKIELCQKRTERERREQNRLAQKYYKKK